MQFVKINDNYFMEVAGKKVIGIQKYRNTEYTVSKVSRIGKDGRFYGDNLPSNHSPFIASSIHEAKKYAEEWYNANCKANPKELPAVDAEFFPTPSKIAGKMMGLVDWKRVKSILEPSAGKGDLLDAMVSFGKNACPTVDGIKYTQNYIVTNIEEKIDCIEIDPNLQYILVGKGFRLIGDDFLNFATTKKYDLVVMNPPFSNGDLHLLKAIQLLDNGGQIVCLLNAETIRNPYTNTRKLLAQKLSEHHAKIEFIENAFQRSARPTDVEIALIYLDIPEKKRKSILFDGLKKAEEHKKQAVSESNAVAKGNWAEAMVDAFQFEAKLGNQLIQEYAALSPYIMNGTDAYSKPIIEIRIGNTAFNGNSFCSLSEAIDSYMKILRNKYWRNLLSKDEITSKLTYQMKTEYDNKLNDLANYDFTMFNIQRFILEINAQCNKGVEDTLEGLFDKLTHEHSWISETSKNIHYYNGWKTNKANKIGKKVILPANGLFSTDWRTNKKTNLNPYDVCRWIYDLERAFDFLNNGKIDFHENAQMQVERAVAAGRTKVHFTYFDAQFYKKGTVHLTFHEDAFPLIDRLNILVGRKRNWLPPTYGKCAYQNMSAIEKGIVDSFHGNGTDGSGEQAYSGILHEASYYLADASSNILLLNSAT